MVPWGFAEVAFKYRHEAMVGVGFFGNHGYFTEIFFALVYG